jgi:hypothetical protein
MSNTLIYYKWGEILIEVEPIVGGYKFVYDSKKPATRTDGDLARCELAIHHELHIENGLEKKDLVECNSRGEPINKG